MNHILKILHQNIDGLITKANDLYTTIDSLNETIDVICITEHNMISSDIDILHIPNYSICSHFSRKNRRGGSCILLHNKHKFHKLALKGKYNVTNVFEYSVIELAEQDIIIACIYRSPKHTVIYVDHFIGILNDFLKELCEKNKKLILCGDFNIDT